MLKVTHYIEFLTSSGQSAPSPQCYQPYFINETRTFGGKSYAFAPFAVAGDVSTDGDESGDYELTAPANPISSAMFWQASEDVKMVRINTVLLAGEPPLTATGWPTWEEVSLLDSTVCVCDYFGYSDSVPGEEEQFSAITLRLTNPLNFVSGTAPTRRLTAAQVGPLPSSGGITF